MAKLLVGENDLKTLFPEIAKDAHGWDPSEFTKGSHDKKKWKCREYDHIYCQKIYQRTGTDKSGCSICSGKEVLKGFNDLKTLFPEIAKDAHGWDPSEFTKGSSEEKRWKCKEHGHIYKSPIQRRTGKQKSGCPYCSGQKVLKGFNDLKTFFPEIAKEADGWDPSEFTKGSRRKKRWKCKEYNHIYDSSIIGRTNRNNGCPYCGNKKLLIGFNDLETRFPLIAKEAFGWNPRDIISDKNTRTWKCSECKHVWDASINNRTHRGSGCPSCAETGYNSKKPGWFYLMERGEELQIGITNHLDQRIKQHKKSKWSLLDVSKKLDGKKVLETEKKFKRFLLKKIGLISGTKENWERKKMNITSLKELKMLTKIETDIF